MGTRLSELVERPWESWQVVASGDGYQVKRINVDPHSRLSLQTHVQRAEHWVVVSGIATCLVGDTDLLLGQRGSLDVPSGVAHRLANAGDHELVVIDVQLGKYTGEGDILRLEDDYGR